MTLLQDFNDLLHIVLRTFLSKQKLNRLPEPDLVTINQEAVEDYNRAMNSPLVLLYVLNLQFQKLLLKDKNSEITALDLACGPGIFTAWMCQHLKLKSLFGLDLSLSMLEQAAKRFENLELPCHYEFHQQDITDLSRFSDGTFDLNSKKRPKKVERYSR